MSTAAGAVRFQLIPNRQSSKVFFTPEFLETETGQEV